MSFDHIRIWRLKHDEEFQMMDKMVTSRKLTNYMKSIYLHRKDTIVILFIDWLDMFEVADCQLQKCHLQESEQINDNNFWWL